MSSFNNTSTSKTKSAKKLDPKAAKKCCRKCGDLFRTKQMRLNHELTCRNINADALHKAWLSLTPEQQAEYGTPQKLHESCLQMIQTMDLKLGPKL